MQSSGLVKKLPTVNTMSAPKLKRPKKSSTSAANDDYAKNGRNPENLDELDIILDDEEDIFFE